MEIQTIPPVAKVVITFPFDELLAIKNALIQGLDPNQETSPENQAILDDLMEELQAVVPD